jgi:fatty-acyl-CoA synthase
MPDREHVDAALMKDELSPWNLDHLAPLWPERVALIDPDRRVSYSYKDLQNRSRSVACFLYERGVRAGDRVGMLDQCAAPALDLLFACARLGAILAPLNWRLSLRELRAVVEDVAPRIIVAGSEYMGQALDASVGAAVIGFDELAGDLFSLSSQGAIPNVPVRMSDPWLILYTGGTTGTPKGAMLTHGSITWNGINTAVSWGLSQEDSGPVFTPTFHTGFWNVFTLPLLLLGGCVIIPERFEPGEALRIVTDVRPTLLFMVPTMFQLVSEQSGFDEADFSSLRWAISGGAPLPAPVYERWKTKVPMFKQGYGLTEVGPNNFATPDEATGSKPGSVGRLTMFARARIVDDGGRDTVAGSPGELLLAGPHMCAGYWRNLGATAEAIQDGWFHTGDIARRDEDGFYFIVDRKKDIVITGGENVYPMEVETVLYTHPLIREVAVVGVPDVTWGESVTAVISLYEGHVVSEAELREFAREQLARYKVPKRFLVVEDIPKSGANKISRAICKEMAIEILRTEAQRTT